MDIEQLITFERTVREGSLSRAARTLNIAQATISARVQALERTVGGPLFVRSGRGVILTDLGMSFYPYAQRALEVLQAGVLAAQQAHTGQRGRVTIGTLESLSGAFLGPVLADFHATHPNVDLVVRAGRHEHMLDLLHDGIITLALIGWPCGEALTNDLEVLLTLRERVVLAAAPTHPLAHHQTIDATQLGALARPFLTLRWWTTLPVALARVVQHVQPSIDVPMDTGRQMVLSGVGAGFFPWMQVAESLVTDRLRAIGVRDLPELVRTSALVRRRTAPPLTAAAVQFVTIIRERSRQLGLYL